MFTFTPNFINSLSYDHQWAACGNLGAAGGSEIFTKEAFTVFQHVQERSGLTTQPEEPFCWGRFSVLPS